ncbi:MAG: sorbosone dehydrogenase family protein, partial [Salinibacter sp.]
MNGTSGSDIASTRPDESRFERTVFADRLDEPIELDVTPNGRVVYIERYGDVHLYSPDRRKNMLLAELDVEAVFSNGLLGVTLDPNFETNRWVYLYYSPVTEGQKIQRLSRFKLRDNDLLLDTEQVIIEVPVQREYHAHTGGSLAFGPKGNLYVAVGDNVSPFTSGTRYPMDERPGKAPFDAQGTSLNTNNLNGKILRIRPDSGGGYTVPEGNLFPKGTPRTKPEIYVMGARNPYRLSVDHKTGFLYYGNMGGVDELHQVREPGLYGGWPYFYGDRQPYPRAEKMKEDSLNPDAPRNTSPNNTGRTTLPPVQPALLWYEKEHFPALPGEGGKGVVAGPVYHSDRYPESPRKFPDYYDGKLFFYDYVRDWIKIVHFDENHEFEGMEPFLPSTSFSSPIDMEFGPDGAMYLLEYGSTGYSQNPDARLSRIDYIRGNRPPEATLAASPRAGTAPLTVRLSATESFDYDEDDSLQYRWSAAA